MKVDKVKKSGFNYKAARQFLKKKELKIIQRNKELFEKAENDCRNIVTMIIEKYSPKRVYQWGSLLHPDQFREYSDIDLAVEGITDVEIFFSLIGDAMRLTRFHLDIVQIEKIEPEFAESIITRGKTVYERT